MRTSRIFDTEANKLAKPLLYISSFFVTSIVSFAALALPTAYQTTFLFDVFFMWNLGWAVHNGLRPIIDFQDFYGGVLARILAFSIDVVGPVARTINITLVVLYAFIVCCLGLVAWKRLSWAAWWTALWIVAALIFTANPLELPNFSVLNASYAMLYNRVGWLMLFISMLPALLPAKEGDGNIGILTCSITSFVMILNKITFCPALLLIAMSIYVLSGFRALCVWLLGFAVCCSSAWLVLGVGPHEWIGQAKALVSIGGTQLENRLGPISKLSFTLFRNTENLIAVVFTCFFLLRRRNGNGMAQTLLIMLFVVGGVLISVTTGSFATQAVYVPISAMASVVFCEILFRRRFQETGIWFSVLYPVLALVLPTLASAVVTDIRQWRSKPTEIEMHSDDLVDGLLVRPEDGAVPLKFPSDTTGSRHLVIHHLLSERSLNALTQQEIYVIISEGAQLLHQLPGVLSLGVVTPYPSTFPFLMRSKVVKSLSFWNPSDTAARYANKPFESDVDVLMFVRDDDSAAPRRSALLERARHDFEFCRSSLFWDLYVRAGYKSANPDACDGKMPGPTQ